MVVTGMGVVSPLGHNLHCFWQRLRAGESGVDYISRFDASAYPTRMAAEIRDFSLLELADVPRTWASLDLISQYAAAAASMAVQSSRLLRASPDRSRIGVLLACGPRATHHVEVAAPCAVAAANPERSFDRSAFERQLRMSLPARAAERHTPGTLPARLAQWYCLGGPVMSVMTACSGATQAIGDATRWIRMDLADAVITGGADAEVTPMDLASFCLLGALSTRNHPPAAASRPFDRDRDGFVLGEGAGVLILEEMRHAFRRGASVLAEIVGFGSACDAYRVTDPHPEGLGAVLAMKRALGEARISPSDVGYINAHGTSTVLNDRIETHAIRQVFGESSRSVGISSTKSMLGHLLVASGAVEAIATVLSLRARTLHPTINYETPDPDCDLDYVPNHARPADVEFALSNSFAFGGQCATLALRRFDE